jgi:hypothetical protein
MTTIIRAASGTAIVCGPVFHPKERSMFFNRRFIATAAVAMIAASSFALAQTTPQHHASSAVPRMPGQDAFGAIQEIVRMLDADPRTDWSRVDLEALRQHLIDMNDVTLKAEVAATPIDGGVAIAVTGAGRTVEAIQRMVPAHAHEVEHTHLNGWSAKAETLPNGVRLTVTASDSREVAHIRGLGFIGLLASGSHHQPHHLAMARGEFAHAH